MEPVLPKEPGHYCVEEVRSQSALSPCLPPPKPHPSEPDASVSQSAVCLAFGSGLAALLLWLSVFAVGIAVAAHSSHLPVAVVLHAPISLCFLHSTILMLWPCLRTKPSPTASALQAPHLQYLHHLVILVSRLGSSVRLLPRSCKRPPPFAITVHNLSYPGMCLRPCIRHLQEVC